MFSHKLPYDKFNFTGQILEALENGAVPTFESDWDAPEELEQLALQCMSTSPLDRPDCDTILVALVKIGDRFSSLNNVVERIRQKYGPRRITRNSRFSLLNKQLKNVESKIEKLNWKEEETLRKLAEVQQELERIREIKDTHEQEKLAIKGELDLLA